VRLLFAAHAPEVIDFSVPLPDPIAVRGLFGAIAADRHAAPSSRSPARMIGKQQRTALSFAGSHAGEIFLTHEFRQRFADRQEQRFRRSPAPHHSQFQAIAIAVVMPCYLVEHFVALQEPVQRP
jgi:hypothetical protein